MSRSRIDSTVVVVRGAAPSIRHSIDARALLGGTGVGGGDVLARDDRPAPPRSRSERIADTLERLRSDVDLWVASASADGEAYLVPLSYYWDGMTLTVATPRASRTARDLIRTGRARVALGPTRDVVIVEGTVEAVELGTDPELEVAHARSAGFDPRTLEEEYVYLRITPVAIQAWREANELEGRFVMRDGRWLES
jgi:hypothetical protein